MYPAIIQLSQPTQANTLLKCCKKDVDPDIYTWMWCLTLLRSCSALAVNWHKCSSKTWIHKNIWDMTHLLQYGVRKLTWTFAPKTSSWCVDGHHSGAGGRIQCPSQLTNLATKETSPKTFFPKFILKAKILKWNPVYCLTRYGGLHQLMKIVPLLQANGCDRWI